MSARASQPAKSRARSFAYTVCPRCGLRINLFARKDFESFSNVETVDHYKAEHPEVLAGYEFGMPYTPIHFDEEV